MPAAPPMNWRVSALDGLTLVSNSDAHSPSRLGREASLLDTERTYPALAEALHTGKGFGGTLEFFPEEGKYHLDGHRKCGVCLTPRQTLDLGGLCPVCGKPLTVGVAHRVEEMADRPEGFRPEGARPFESLVSLPELLAERAGFSKPGKRVMALYETLLRELGPELFILREAELPDVERLAGRRAAEGIRRMRQGRVERSPGFDGAYGRISFG